MGVWNPKANSLFLDAIEMSSPDQRVAFLDEACAGDPALRAEVEQLLKAHDDAGSFLERPLLDEQRTQDFAAATDRDDPAAATGPWAGGEVSLDFLEPCDVRGRLGRIGPYEVIDVIGVGGMGMVLRAHDPKLNRIVAVKVMAPHFVVNPTARKRFLREAQAAAAVTHPHVVAIHAVEQTEKVSYLVMECINGQSLEEKIDRCGHLELKEILRIGAQIAAGLAAAHAHGLVHRDIKPSNILLENGVERVRITDFGLARAVDDVDLTRSGEVAGTPQFMSPEQAQGKPVDHRSDLFSLGAVLYTMCTGRTPFRAETTVAVLRRVCDDVPRPIQEVNPDIPEQLAAIVDRLLAKDPEERFQTAQEVADLLLSYLAHLQDPASTPLPELLTVRPAADRRARAAGATPVGPWPRRTVLLAATVLLGLCISVAVTEATGVTHLTAAILRIATGAGTLVVEVDDPQVGVTIDGEDLIISGTGPQEVRLKPGQYQVQAAKDGQLVKQELVTIERGGRQVLRVALEPSATPPATARFDAATARKPQERWAKQLGVPVEITNSIGMKLVLIPPGEFMMGSPEELVEEELRAHADDYWYKDHLLGEGPQHRVRITRPFYLGTYLVTQGEYQRVIGTNPSAFSATGNSKDKVAGQETKRFPVECVSWDDAVEFCAKLSNLPEEKAAGRWYRLPSEAQWEYACRAGSTGRYSFSAGGNGMPKEYEEHRLSAYGWFGDNAGGMPHAVGLKRVSAWGLYDMHGNVWEWCQDWHDKYYYASSPTDDPAGPPAGSARVGRGGSWGHPAGFCRSAHRGHDLPGYRHDGLGFRVSLVLADTAAGRTKMGHATDAAQPSTGATAGKPSPTPPGPNPQSPIPLTVGSLVGPDGKWKLPPGAPPPAVAPFDEKKAKEHQDGWAKQLGVPVEITNSIGMKLVLIPPGEFLMGSPKELIEEELKARGDDQFFKDHLPSEGPQRPVRITRPFYFAVYDVTQEEYQRVMGNNPSWFCATGSGKDAVDGFDSKRFPVEQVLWDEAVEFCRKLSEMPEEKAARRRYCLPTEAQWEYACRAGSTGRYSFGSPLNTTPKEYDEHGLSDYGWFNGNAGGRPHAVGRKQASAWGLYDMHGNVWQWCQDWYDEGYYAKSATDDPAGPPGGANRVVRGCSWMHPVGLCRSAIRHYWKPGEGNRDVGFRVSLVLPDTAAERAKVSRITQAAQPSAGSTANKPAPAAVSPAAQSLVQLPAVGSLVAADGKWNLPVGAPVPAVAPFDPPKAKEHQEGWAKHLGVPVEITNSIGMKLLLIPPGEFLMGSPKELIEEELKAHGDDKWYRDQVKDGGPQHRVRITTPFYFGVYDVTQEEYQRVMGRNPSEYSATGEGKAKVEGQDTKRFPVEQVSWDDAVEFCRELSNLPQERTAGRWYRLPTEAQWEYACRAGSTGRYSFSLGSDAIPKESDEKTLCDYGWFGDNSGGRTHAVGRKRANAWGLYDVHGNVWQWCQDWYDKDYYAASPADDPTGAPGGPERVRRGGSQELSARFCRSARRILFVPGLRLGVLGMRVSLVLNAPPPLPRGQWVDLLPRVDLKRDDISGRWSCEGGKLIGMGDTHMMLPATVEGDYDLEITYALLDGINAWDIAIPVGPRQCEVKFNESVKKLDGIELIDGKRVNENPTSVSQPACKHNEAHTVLVRVRTQAGHGTIDVLLDAAPHIHWAGDIGLLTLRDKVWGSLRGDQLGLATWQTHVRFDRVRVRLVPETADRASPKNTSQQQGNANAR